MNKTKKLILLAASAVLLLGTVGTTLAYLFTSDGPLTNIFSPSKVGTDIVEDISDGEKKDVYIENTGDTPVYIRAIVIINWLDSDGNVVVGTPDGYSYEIDWGYDDEDTKWTENGEYYYYTEAVGVGLSTGNLINSCSWTSSTENPGYTLSVEILSQAIQAEPDEAVISAWGVEVITDTDGNKTISVNGGTN